MDKQALIENLNQDLAGELGAIIQYLTYAAKATGPYRPQLVQFFLAEIADEQMHAQFLANKIVALGGEPTTRPRPVPAAHGNHEMLEAVLAAERQATQDYAQRAREADEFGDKGLRPPSCSSGLPGPPASDQVSGKYATTATGSSICSTRTPTWRSPIRPTATAWRATALIPCPPSIPGPRRSTTESTTSPAFTRSAGGRSCPGRRTSTTRCPRPTRSSTTWSGRSRRIRAGGGPVPPAVRGSCQRARTEPLARAGLALTPRCGESRGYHSSPSQ
jgi:bacterioferritin